MGEASIGCILLYSSIQDNYTQHVEHPPDIDITDTCQNNRYTPKGLIVGKLLALVFQIVFIPCND